MYTRIKTDKEINAMRIGGSACAQILGLLCSTAEPGMTTKYLAEIAKTEIKKLGMGASFLGYNGFPDVICISVNDEIVHGIPSEKKILAQGDIISFDLGVTNEGMIVDSARSVIIDDNDKKKQLLLKETEASLFAGIDQIKHGCRVGDIAESIQKVLDRQKFGIVRDLVGHGVGHAVHEEPNIPNFGFANSGPLLKSGMTIAVEPMATLGSEKVFIDMDGWTVKSSDGSLSAHFEHTVLVKVDGYEVLTSL